MTDEDRERFEPATSPDDAGDPAAAFEALRRTVETQGKQLNAEMTIIRKGVELALEQTEKFRQPPDYGPDLGKIIQFLAIVDERLEAVEQSPILRNGPEHYARALERSGESLVRTAAQQLENESRDFQRVGHELAEHIAGARERNRQDWWLVGVGAAGVILGILLMLFAPRVLPFSTDTHVAAIVMGQSRWNAGLDMMGAHNRTRLNEFLYADELMQANLAAVSACYESARDSNEAQSCTITVSAPPTQPEQ